MNGDKMNTTFFYFSGTGNSLFVSREIARHLGNAVLIPINSKTLTMKHELPERIGFVFPVYFCGIPNIVREFISSLSIKPETYIFSVGTLKGGDYLSHQQIDDVLSTKNAKLSYHASVVMPGNYQIFYDITPPAKQAVLFNKAKAKTKQIAEEINNNQVVELKHKTGLLAKLLGSYYRKLYQIPGGKDYNFAVNTACTKCGSCAKICPVSNITMDKGCPVWHGKCQLCLACLHWCPTRAIDFSTKTIKRGRYHHPEVNMEDIVSN